MSAHGKYGVWSMEYGVKKKTPSSSLPAHHSRKGFSLIRTCFASRWGKFYRSLAEPCQGFTLIELMVAISIVAILSTIGMVMFSSAQGSARDAKRKGDLEDLKKALYLYRTTAGTFCLSGSTAAQCAWMAPVNHGQFGFGGTDTTSTANRLATYIKNGRVDDPKCPAGACATGWADYCIHITTAETFFIYAQLEGNTGTTSYASPGAACPSTAYNFRLSE